MKKLYCPDCGAYLEGGSGELVDCHCGWKQPVDAKYYCEGCGNDDAEYLSFCTQCGSMQCNLCSMGDDVECGNCTDGML